ncbi:MAG: ankyrin repeat domain-containing protein [Gammaproteobacteria bacterium]|nr:ankyrin repeat domain-containing protein [Gammaproteobacteria bacterium]
MVRFFKPPIPEKLFLVPGYYDPSQYPLHAAVAEGSLDKARYLLIKTPNVANKQDKFMRTPFQVACILERYEVIGLLLARNATIHQPTFNQFIKDNIEKNTDAIFKILWQHLTLKLHCLAAYKTLQNAAHAMSAMLPKLGLDQTTIDKVKTCFIKNQTAQATTKVPIVWDRNGMPYFHIHHPSNPGRNMAPRPY